MSHDIAVQAYERLYGKSPREQLAVQYHGNLKAYNATVTKTSSKIVFRLSRKLERCEPEIQIGVVQYLLNRINRTKIGSDEQELYHSFVRKMSDFAPVTESDEDLGEAFDRLNDRYFGGMMSRPNLVWGRRTRRLLGTYTYATDTIMISSALKGAPQEVLDSVMYHEMLHKKHKFSCRNGRTHSHTPAFKKEEKNFYDPLAERKLARWLR